MQNNQVMAVENTDLLQQNPAMPLEQTAVEKDKKKFNGGKAKKRAARIGTYAILILYAVFLLFPFCVILIYSVSDMTHLNTFYAKGFFIPYPENWTFQNYLDLFNMEATYRPLATGGSVEVPQGWINMSIFGVEGPGFLIGLFNTLWQVVPTLIIGLLVSGAAAFAYAKLNFPLKKTLFAIQIGIIVLPLGTLTVPTYFFFSLLGWQESVLPIILPGLFGGATTIFYLTQYMRGIPTDIVDAAALDGLGTLGIYFKIILPLSFPAFFAQLILGFVGGYNNYMGPLLYLQSQQNEALWPLQYSFDRFRTQHFSFDTYGLGIQCAGILLAMLPLIIFFIIFRKQFKEGLTDGGVKG